MAQDSAEAANQRRTTARRELIETQIHEHAARLFAQRGFAGTSLGDIAESVGITRQALYYYVKSKDEILAKLVADLTSSVVTRTREIRADTTLGHAERLRRIAYLTVMDRARDRTRFQLLDRSASALPPELADAFLEGRRLALAELRGVIEDGITAGEFRPLDARVGALSVLGMCNWVAWWYEPGPDHPAEPIAEQMSDCAVAMLRSEPTGTDPLAALATARASLDQLERQLRIDNRRG
ncbi:TetR/AcrR family transcriptional regulator [[Mycobacterium] crassicus]|uniref:TetR/AcrR family transcriptional regulator n=1 Tax=[Mycobacterium] crassicus TaxID=2872309 RepID=A0ABU5XN08_9MYCO|nr:TetR/AcrR family transcriptional regulator [Mycolicibacter sp. MYC098]MEB3023142.1 TetR/AcrR family transcriptional regulator [Mycolicibacter sp. MYC098]